MTVEIKKDEAIEILTTHLKTMFPNMNIVATAKYDTFEFEITKEDTKATQ